MTPTGGRPAPRPGARRRPVLQVPGPAGALLPRLLHEFQRLEPFDRAMTLAAQAFTSIFPLVIALLSVLRRPDARDLGERLADWLALPAGSRAVLVDTGEDGTGQAATFGALSLLIVLLSATGFSRALTRMYARAWSVRPPGWTGGWRWIVAILGIATCTVVLQALQRSAEGNRAAVVGALLLTLLVNTALWTWVPSLLLAGKVARRLLLPGGACMGLATVGMFFVSRLYMPRALEHAERAYGELGVAFTYIGWLFGASFVLIATTVLGMVLATPASSGPREPEPQEPGRRVWDA